MKFAVSVKNLSYAFDNEPVLRNVSIDLPEKSFLVLIGPNGGGKSTFLKLLLGLLPCKEGTISIFGTSVSGALPRVGYVPQDTEQMKSFPVNVMDVAMMGFFRPSVQKLSMKNIVKKAEEALDQFGMLDYKDARLNELSTGQRQRVLLSRAIANKPDLLALDEPISGVDPHGQKIVLETLKNNFRDTTILFVSHDLSVIPGNATAVACVNRTLTYHPAGEVTEQVLSDAYGVSNVMTLVAHECRCETPHD